MECSGEREILHNFSVLGRRWMRLWTKAQGHAEQRRQLGDAGALGSRKDGKNLRDLWGFWLWVHWLDPGVIKHAWACSGRYGWGHVNFEVSGVCVYMKMSVNLQEIRKYTLGVSYLEIQIWNTRIHGGKMRYREMEAAETIVQWAITA